MDSSAPHRAAPSARILVVDDDADMLRLLSLRLKAAGHDVVAVGSAEAALAQLDIARPQLVLSDVRLPGRDGLALFDEVRARHPSLPVILLTAHGTIPDAVEATSRGVFTYLTKPYDGKELLEKIAQALALSAPAVAQPHANEDWRAEIVSRSHRMTDLLSEAYMVAQSDASVLLRGDSGSGKELLARAIHYASPRAERAFVLENCAAMSETLLESELFGHKRGAFTGAFEDHVGLFQRADGGTIFLDEIGDTSPAFQVKLLRVLQEGEVRPVGASRPVAVDVRVIAATHRDLEQDVRSGRFREDLYYRIASMTLTVPPLRERSADVLPIADMLLGQACQELARPALGFSPEVRASLLAYPWPGNIRELKNEVYRAVALSEGPQVSAAALSCRVLHGQQGASAAAQPGLQIPGSGSLQERLDAIEAAILRETLLRHRWNKTHAAKELGLSRMGLRQKLARFGLEGQADG